MKKMAAEKDCSSDEEKTPGWPQTPCSKLSVVGRGRAGGGASTCQWSHPQQISPCRNYVLESETRFMILCIN